MISDGILVLNKPRNWTSHDCVAVCRRVLRLKGIKKIGHGGTLDPMAEGVLPIFIGQATRIMEYLELDHKHYRCEMQLGIRTDTQDIWGQVLSRRDFCGISEARILEELEGFRGVISQMPPLYSAVRVDGKHLYEYARREAGKAGRGSAPQPDECGGQAGRTAGGDRDHSVNMAAVLDRVQPRRVYIPSLEIEEIDLAEGRLRFSVECSKGTYIRTICSELGERLGCGGAMSALTRTAVGSIGLKGAVSPVLIKSIDQKNTGASTRETEREHGTKTGLDGQGGAGSIADFSAASIEDLLLPADAPLRHFGRIIMPIDRARYFRQGGSIRLGQVRITEKPQIPEDPLSGRIPCNARGRQYDRIYRVYQENGMFLGTGYLDQEQGLVRADKVFAALNEPKKEKNRL